MLPRVKEKAEQLQRNEIMLKMNAKKTIKKMGGNVKLNYISCHMDTMKFLSVSALLKSEKSKKQKNVLFTVIIFLTQSFLSF